MGFHGHRYTMIPEHPAQGFRNSVDGWNGHCGFGVPVTPSSFVLALPPCFLLSILSRTLLYDHFGYPHLSRALSTWMIFAGVRPIIEGVDDSQLVVEQVLGARTFQYTWTPSPIILMRDPSYHPFLVHL